MNPSHPLQLPQLAHPFKHAGGWEKLGWRSHDAEHGHDRAGDGLLVEEDEAEPGLYA